MGKKDKPKNTDPVYRAALLEKRKLKKEKKLLKRKQIRKTLALRNSSLRPIDWPSLNLVPPKKDIYQEYVKPSNLSPEEVERYRQEKCITIKGAAPNPITSFDEVCFPEFCMQRILANFEEPTPAQAQIWPIVISGHNMVFIAKDDSGKDLGYILPAILHIRAQPPPTPGGSIVLILCPNNHNVETLKSVVEEYTSKSSIKSVCAINGVTRKKIIQNVALGNHIIIGTPGCVADLLIDRFLSLKTCTFIVINDIDRMTGSENQVRQIIGQARPDSQILMLATSEFTGMNLVELIRDHIEVNIEPRNLRVSSVITQHVDVVMENEKGPKLKEVLLRIYANQNPRGKILIFVATNRRVGKVKKFITSFLECCSAITPETNKQSRAQLLNEFQTGKRNILITTDSSGRYIKVNKIMYVINFDYPLDSKDYIRRLGRIDPGVAGHAYTFFTRRDALFAPHLIEVLRKTRQFVSGRLWYMGKVGSDPSKNSIPKYYPRTKSGLVVERRNRTAESEKVGSSAVENEETESDSDDAVPAESADCSGFDNKRNDAEFGSRGSGSGFCSGGFHAGSGNGFASDNEDFRGNEGASGFVGSGNELSIGGGGSGYINRGVGFHAGGGAGFGNMVDNTGFSNHASRSGFGYQEDQDLNAGFGNTNNAFGRDEDDSYHSTGCGGDGIGIADGRYFENADGGNVHGFGSPNDESRFGNLGGNRNVGGDTGYYNSDGDAVFTRNNFTAERDHDSCSNHDFNTRNNSSNFNDYDRSGGIDDFQFNRERNDNFDRRGTDSNFGDRGDDSYRQGNGNLGSGGSFSRSGGFSGTDGLAGSSGFAGIGGFSRTRDFNGGSEFAGGGDFAGNGSFARSGGFAGSSDFAVSGDFAGSGGFARNRDFAGGGDVAGNGDFARNDNFARSGGDRIREYGISDGFVNRDNSNFRRGDDSRFHNKDEDNFNMRNNFAFNNRSDRISEQDTLFTRRDGPFDNRSARGSYSGGHESNRNRPYNPQGGRGRGRASAYGR